MLACWLFITVQLLFAFLNQNNWTFLHNPSWDASPRCSQTSLLASYSPLRSSPDVCLRVLVKHKFEHVCMCVCESGNKNSVCAGASVTSLGQDVRDVWNTSNVWEELEAAAVLLLVLAASGQQCVFVYFGRFFSHLNHLLTSIFLVFFPYEFIMMFGGTQPRAHQQGWARGYTGLTVCHNTLQYNEYVLSVSGTQTEWLTIQTQINVRHLQHKRWLWQHRQGYRNR